MQEYRVTLTKSAERDLAQIYDYLEELDSGYTALAAVRKIRRMIATLKIFPRRKHLEGYSQDLWMVHIGKYNILYTINDRERLVKVVYIIPAKRDYTRFLTPKE